MEFEGKKELVKTRLYQKGDLNFIYSTWLKGLYYGSGGLKVIQEDDFFKLYHSYLDRLFGHPKIEIHVSCLVEDEDVILGYAVTEEDTLHWVFVKGPWRKLGIAKDIIPSNINGVTQLTNLGRFLKPKDWAIRQFKP